MSKTILITGCSSGIGYAAAHGLRARGWRVFAAVRTQDDRSRMEAEGLESAIIDHGDGASIESGLGEVLDRTGGTLDALFNNGAHGLSGAVEDLPPGALREIFEANVIGLHDLTTRVIPVMRAQGHGRIVNHSSVLGLVPLKWRGAYATSKHALEGLTDCLRIEMAGTGIHVSTLNTGPVTSMIRIKSIPHFEKWIDWENSVRVEEYRNTLVKRLYEERGPDKFELPPEAVVRKLVHALESPRPRPRYYITFPAHLAAFLKRILPQRTQDWITTRY
ncbi:SDR family NAD(P)-dependent oxidoreductase [Rhodobacterales bacterium HKCCE4037]|nr:SDR family NAD(P)-dependent oxidoreductase [Rhodobacterales bacterium HKCCE4037]